jgi:hypothetical protein
MLHTGAAPSNSRNKSRVALLEGLRRTQEKDGLWKASSQFHSMKRPKQESNEVNTIWVLLALSYVDPLPETLVNVRARARASIEKCQPGVSTESLLLHLLLAHAERNQDRSSRLVEKLLQLQRPDGGWAAFKENADSDALTTGQVVYGLTVLGRGPTGPCVQKAAKYLLRMQQADGSWSVPWLTFNVENKKDHKEGNKVFAYWGTAWSALGLMATLPKSIP